MRSVGQNHIKIEDDMINPMYNVDPETLAKMLKAEKQGNEESSAEEVDSEGMSSVDEIGYFSEDIVTISELL